MPRVYTGVRLPAALYAKLRADQTRRGVTMRAIVEAWLRDYLRYLNRYGPLEREPLEGIPAEVQGQ